MAMATIMAPAIRVLAQTMKALMTRCLLLQLWVAQHWGHLCQPVQAKRTWWRTVSASLTSILTRWCLLSTAQVTSTTGGHCVERSSLIGKCLSGCITTSTSGTRLGWIRMWTPSRTDCVRTGCWVSATNVQQTASNFQTSRGRPTAHSDVSGLRLLSVPEGCPVPKVYSTVGGNRGFNSAALGCVCTEAVKHQQETILKKLCIVMLAH